MENEPEFLSVTFDMQSVLQIPCGSVSQLYYKRKLNVYNLTINEAAAPNNAHYNFWLEVDGKRGSYEIGSILFRYLQQASNMLVYVRTVVL